MTDTTIARFLRYSMERGRPIRMMWTEPNGKLRVSNVQVLSYEEGLLQLLSLRPKAEFTLDEQAILSASYRSGDEGQDA